MKLHFCGMSKFKICKQESICYVYTIINCLHQCLLCFTTIVSGTISDTEFTTGGYTTFRKDRGITNYTSGTYVQNNRGGVLLLIKNYLNPTIYTDADVEAEIIWVTLTNYVTQNL